jgi:glycosyltransferase involved in cell wall biosynthesis
MRAGSISFDIPMTRVTIAIPNRNGGRFIGETIASLLAQTHRDFQLFVLDDHSEDDSVAVVRGFDDPRLELRESAERLTMVGTWNRLFDCPSAPYVVLAHNDDVYEPTYLERMVAFLDENPSAFMAHCRTQMIDEAGRPYDAPIDRYKDRFWPKRGFYVRTPREEIDNLLHGNFVIAPSVMFRTSATDRVGRFSEEYQFVTDWEYWLRGILKGFSIAGLADRLVRWRRHPGAATMAHERALSRYSEEIRLLDWATREAHAQGLVPNAAADYALVHKTVAMELANRLSRGDAPGARALLEFAVADVPSFRFSPLHAVLRTALPFGAAGGRLLKALEQGYVRVASKLTSPPS